MDIMNVHQQNPLVYKGTNIRNLDPKEVEQLAMAVCDDILPKQKHCEDRKTNCCKFASKMEVSAIFIVNLSQI